MRQEIFYNLQFMAVFAPIGLFATILKPIGWARLYYRIDHNGFHIRNRLRRTNNIRYERPFDCAVDSNRAIPHSRERLLLPMYLEGQKKI